MVLAAQLVDQLPKFIYPVSLAFFDYHCTQSQRRKQNEHTANESLFADALSVLVS